MPLKTISIQSFWQLQSSSGENTIDTSGWASMPWNFTEWRLDSPKQSGLSRETDSPQFSEQ